MSQVNELKLPATNQPSSFGAGNFIACVIISFVILCVGLFLFAESKRQAISTPSTSILSVPEYTAEEKKTRVFTFEGMSIGMTFDEYTKQRGTNWTFHAKGANNPDPTEIVSHTPTKAKKCQLDFFERKCIRLIIVYDMQTVKSLGGDALLGDKIIEQFGAAHSKVSDRVLKWDFKAVNRTVFVHISPEPDQIWLEIIDNEGVKAATEKKVQNANFGFGK